MNFKDLKLGEYYRHRSSPNNHWAVPRQVLVKKGKKIVECMWIENESFASGIIKHFRVSDLINGGGG